MNWDDWEMIWRRQEPPVGADADVALLRQTFEPKRRKLARGLLVRNAIEGVGGVLGAALLVGFAWHVGPAGWPILLGAALILGVAVVFLRDLVRIRRSRVGPEASLLAKLEAEIAELRHQRRLLTNIGTWYFLPYLLAMAIVASTTARIKVPAGVLTALLTTPAALAWIVVLAGTTAFFIGWAWWDNGVVARKRCELRLAELEKLHREIVSAE
jgi:MFS family permease